ncbi:MAG: hypothetical protein ABR528_04310 [Pseudonocardiaceae bacterium]
MAAAMIGSVDTEPAPPRLMLGSDAYTATRQALQNRLAALEGQEQLASSTDVSD